MNIYNNNTVPNQETFDSFNNFIFSNDIKIIGKLFYKYKFFELTKHLPGDIAEIGVFKGSGVVAWSKILKIFCPNSNKKVIGFDFFSYSDVSNFTKNQVKGESLLDVVNRSNTDDITLESIKYKLQSAEINESKYILIKGDIQITTREFNDSNPGARFSLINIDTDLSGPAYYSLLHLWDKLVPGGYVIFDEYEYHSFDESNGVDRFLKEKNVEYTIETTNFIAPTSFIIKKKL